MQASAQSVRSDDGERVTDGIHAPLKVIADLISEAQKLGEIDGVIDARQTAHLMIALFQGLALQRLWGEPLDEAMALAALDRMLGRDGD